MRILHLSLVLAIILTVTGCAKSKMDALMPQVTTLQQAQQYFGNPSKSEERPDGTVRYEWVKGKAEQVPGQYVTQQIYVGHDSDGFRKYVEREVFVPWHLEGNFCQLIIVADKQGRVLRSDWVGTDCNSLPIVPVPE